MTVAIVDYGSGNLRSASKALERAAILSDARPDIVVTADPDAVRRAERIVLPVSVPFATAATGSRRFPA